MNRVIGRMSGIMKRALCKKEQGMGVIEIILIIVVLISLVLIFKSQLTALVGTIFGNNRDVRKSIKPYRAWGRLPP